MLLNFAKKNLFVSQLARTYDFAKSFTLRNLYDIENIMSLLAAT